jgi:hypothetical protein
MIVVWQLRRAADRERKALRLISFAFCALVVYALAQSVDTLATGHRPAPSIGGLVCVMATVTVVLLLAWGKHATGRGLNN